MSTPNQESRQETQEAPSFEYDPAVKEYLVSPADYLEQHSEYTHICTGLVVFNTQGKLLLVKRSATEKAFPNFWEIPGGKVDEDDRSILHAAARELKEETGLSITRFVRKVTHITFTDEKRVPARRFIKHVFEVEVDQLDTITLDPDEHDAYLFASEEQVHAGEVGEQKLRYLNSDNKLVKVEAFKRSSGVDSA